MEFRAFRRESDERLVQAQFLCVATAIAVFLALSGPVFATVTPGDAGLNAPRDMVLVKIPPSIVPSAPTLYVQPGSRIYVVKEFSVSTHSMIRGIPHTDSAADPSIVRVESTKTGAVIHKRDGSISMLSPNMDVQQDTYQIYVVHPGQPIPLSVQGLAPTLIAQ